MKNCFCKNNFKGLIIGIALVFSLVLAKDGFSQKTNPPGTILLKDNLYIDIIPMCNVHYGEYLYYLRNNLRFNLDSFETSVSKLPYYKLDREILKKTTFPVNPDSANFLIKDTMKKFWSNWMDYESYLNNTKYYFYPIVYISPDVAAKFCKWRSLMVKTFNAMIKTEKKRKKMYDDIIYRLPTIEELELAKTKFISEERFMYQPKAQNDSLPSFQELPKKIHFLITRLNEIATDKNSVRQIYWDTTNNLINKSTLLANKDFGENLAFRCVCEVK